MSKEKFQINIEDFIIDVSSFSRGNEIFDLNYDEKTKIIDVYRLGEDNIREIYVSDSKTIDNLKEYIGIINSFSDIKRAHFFENNDLYFEKNSKGIYITNLSIFFPILKYQYNSSSENITFKVYPQQIYYIVNFLRYLKDIIKKNSLDSKFIIAKDDKNNYYIGLENYLVKLNKRKIDLMEKAHFEIVMLNKLKNAKKDYLVFGNVSLRNLKKVIPRTKGSKRSKKEVFMEGKDIYFVGTYNYHKNDSERDGIIPIDKEYNIIAENTHNEPIVLNTLELIEALRKERQFYVYKINEKLKVLESIKRKIILTNFY